MSYFRTLLLVCTLWNLFFAFAVADAVPTGVPTTFNSTSIPTDAPTIQPTFNSDPSRRPTRSPTSGPTQEPTALPTISPSTNPSLSPSINPSCEPTLTPSFAPSVSFYPTSWPTSNSLPRYVQCDALTCEYSSNPDDCSFASGNIFLEVSSTPSFHLITNLTLHFTLYCKKLYFLLVISAWMQLRHA